MTDIHTFLKEAKERASTFDPVTYNDEQWHQRPIHIEKGMLENYHKMINMIHEVTTILILFSEVPPQPQTVKKVATDLLLKMEKIVK